MVNNRANTQANSVVITKPTAISGPWHEAWKNYRKNHLAMIGLITFVLILLGVIVIPMLSPYQWNDMDGASRYHPPSLKYWLGTMRSGNDLFVNIWYGGRESLLNASLASGVYLFTATFSGLWAGFYGKKLDFILSHLMDFIHALPHVPMLMVSAIGLGFRGFTTS